MPKSHYFILENQELGVNQQKLIKKNEVNKQIEMQEVKAKGTIICDPLAGKTNNGVLRDLNSDSKVFLVMRMHFMIHSFINLYAIQEGTGSCIFGSALPDNL